MSRERGGNAKTRRTSHSVEPRLPACECGCSLRAPAACISVGHSSSAAPLWRRKRARAHCHEEEVEDQRRLPGTRHITPSNDSSHRWSVVDGCRGARQPRQRRPGQGGGREVVHRLVHYQTISLITYLIISRYLIISLLLA